MMSSHLLPEWAPSKAVLIAWPYPGSDWQANLPAAQACYRELLKTLSNIVDVWLLLHPSIPRAEFTQSLVAADIDLARVTIETSVLYDDTWTRDYGPLSLNTGYLQFGFNGWGGKYAAPNDNAVAAHISHLLGQAPVDAGFICEGGGLETNGSVLLVNEDCIVDNLRNPGLDAAQLSEYLIRWLGVDSLEWVRNIQLTGDDTDGHIDTIARFTNSQTLVYAGRNPAHPDTDSLDSLHLQLNGIASRRGWTLVELPSPVVRSHLDGRVLPATYANFLICNGNILVPIYGVEEDVAALAQIQHAAPEYAIIPVRCEALLEQHGSLHCATMQIIDLDKITG